MDKKSKLVDPSGRPISTAEGENESGLPPGVQALIETRIDSAKDDLRERNRDDLKDLSRDHASKWRYLTIISALITLVTLFYAPDKIIENIGNQIDNRLTEPMLMSSADRLIESKMNTYVSEKLSPLNEKTFELELTIDSINKNVIKKQNILEKGQSRLQKQLHIQELSISSKAGSKSSYMELLKINESNTDNNDLLQASIKEIELFYDADRGQVSFPILVKTEIMQDPGFSVDEVIFSLRSNKDLTEAAINTLGKLKSKASIAELSNIALNSEDLRAATRAIRSIEIISDEKIQPLDFEKVKFWWNQNKKNKEFLGDYDGYCEVMKHILKGSISYKEIDGIIKNLSKTIDSDPMAFHSMTLKAGFLLITNQKDKAKEILSEVKKRKSDYYWYYVWNASLQIKEGDLDSAVNSINSAFKKAPVSIVVHTVKNWKIFDPIVNDPRVEWPLNIVQQEKSAEPIPKVVN